MEINIPDDIEKTLFVKFLERESENSIFSETALESYNRCIERDIPMLIESFNPIRVSHTHNNNLTVQCEMKFSKVEFAHQKDNGADIYPCVCHLQAKSYLLDVYATADFTINLEEGGNLSQYFHETKRILYARVPLMVKSRYCHLYKLSRSELARLNEDEHEHGGYFIIGGQDRTVIGQEEKIKNHIYRNIAKDKNGNQIYKVWCQSVEHGTYRYPHYTEVIMDSNDVLWVYISIYKDPKNGSMFPLSVFYRAIGVMSDREIIRNVYGENPSEEVLSILKKSLQHQEYYQTSEKSILTLYNLLHNQKTTNLKKIREKDTDAEKIAEISNKIFSEEFLPHVGSNVNRDMKRAHLNVLARSCIDLRLGILQHMDTDDYGNKRIQTAGTLLASLFRYYISETTEKETKRAMRNCARDFTKSVVYNNIIDTLYTHSKFDLIEGNIKKGEWPNSNQAGYNTKTGVTQLLERKNPKDEIATLMKQILNMSKQTTGKIDMRRLHTTQFGSVDMADTPDGADIGKYKHRTIGTYITMYHEPTELRDLLDNMHGTVVRLGAVYASSIHDVGRIYINGKIEYVITKIQNLDHVFRTLKAAKISGKIMRYTSIICKYKSDEIVIYTDPGRMMRPLLVVDIEDAGETTIAVPRIFKYLNEIKTMSWEDIVGAGCVEWLAGHEEGYNCLIMRNPFMKTRFATHCEISPLMVMDPNTISMPNINLNQSPRVTFNCQMNKQSVAKTNIQNHQFRMDTRKHNMIGATSNLVYTVMDKYDHTDEVPNGISVMVAIYADRGHNVEDAVIFNKESIRNGIGDVQTTIITSATITTNKEVFGYSDPKDTADIQGKSNYTKLDANGNPKIGEKYYNGDIIIGKKQTMSRSEVEKTNGKYMFRDRSKEYDKIAPSTVEHINIIDNDKESKKTKNAKSRINRETDIGDKLATNPAQKGVVSQTNSYSDMPFVCWEQGSSMSGVTPTIMFNPHGVIKRMTCAMNTNHALGLIAATKGIHIDATPFDGIDIQLIIEELEALGFKEHGRQTLINPITGYAMKVTTFIAPLYYMRLMRFADDQVGTRETGLIAKDTRQPVQGKQRNGGFRIGYMERDAYMSHGAISTLEEKFSVDREDVFIDESTGMMCIGNPGSNIIKGEKVARVKMPFVTQKYINFMQTMGINQKFELGD